MAFNWAAAGKSLNTAIVSAAVGVVCGLGYLVWQSHLDTTPIGQENVRINAQTAWRLSADRTERERLKVEEKRLEVEQNQIELERERLSKKE